MAINKDHELSTSVTDYQLNTSDYGWHAYWMYKHLNCANVQTVCTLYIDVISAKALLMV